MGDMGDYWRDVTPALKEQSQKKRASNRTSSANLLTKAGIPFESRNDAAHLILNRGDHFIDFWPGTGLWVTRGWKFTIKGRGVRLLLKHCKDHPV